MFDDLEVFFGDASNAQARIYARLPRAALPAECALTGRVVGPSCAYSRTLPAAIPFVKPLRSGATRPEAPLGALSNEAWLIEAILPDPCFWSQEMPFLYRAELELKSGERIVAAVDRVFGIRPLGARGRALVWSGRPWVPRAADCRELPERPPADWRAADMAMLVSNPSNDLLEEATRLGMVLMADLTADELQASAALRRLARWPAVAMALLSSQTHLDAEVRYAARNLLLAERRDTTSRATPRSWADLVLCDAATATELVRLADGITVPALAQRTAGWCDELTEARRHCDSLQRDLAGHADFAGYLV